MVCCLCDRARSPGCIRGAAGQNSLPFQGCIIFHHHYRPHFGYLFVCPQTPSLLPPLGCRIKAATNVGAWISLQDPDFISSVRLPKSRIAGSITGTFDFLFFKEICPVFLICQLMLGPLRHRGSAWRSADPHRLLGPKPLTLPQCSGVHFQPNFPGARAPEWLRCSPGPSPGGAERNWGEKVRVRDTMRPEEVVLSMCV